jgi:hypothetical protein
MPSAVKQTVQNFLTELEALKQTFSLMSATELPSQWAERITGMKLDNWQRQLMDKPLHDTLLVCARQTGKSTITALLAAYYAAHHAMSVMVIAPSLRQSALAYRKVEAALKSDPAILIARSTATIAELTGGGSVTCLPGNMPSLARGATADIVLLDEGAFVKDSLYAVVSPMLATTSGVMICPTTPAGMQGELHRLWSSGGENWHRVTVTAGQCPRIAPAFLAKERQRLGDLLYSQEYECQFVTSGSGYFSGADLARLFGSDYEAIDEPVFIDAPENDYAGLFRPEA